MKSTFLLLIVILTSTFTYADEKENKTIDLIPKWEKGEKLHYTLIKTRSKTENGLTTLNTKSTTPVEIEVLEANEMGYLITWTLGETVLADKTQALHPLVKMMTNLMKDFTIFLQLDSHATIVDVKNWKDLQKASHRTVQTITQNMEGTGLDKTSIEMLRKQVESMYSTKEQVIMLCTQEPQMFFLTLGRKYPVSSSFDYQDRIANPFGGESFPSNASFMLEKYDAKANAAVVTWKQEIDPVECARIMRNSMIEMLQQMGKPATDDTMFNSINISDSATFTHQLSSGWPLKMQHSRSIKIEHLTQIDSMQFLQVQDDK